MILNIDNFFLKYSKKTHLKKKKTHLFQIYTGISLKKRCVFFFQEGRFFFLDFGKNAPPGKKNAPFFSKKVRFFPILKIKKHTFFAFSLIVEHQKPKHR